ncbi:MAG TPA: fibronectin type III domain-containing protein, partial [Chthoniobacterales bacterium]|nr:fibronectin type III domain-containing protein [Chthoniobacterales bacterium]
MSYHFMVYFRFSPALFVVAFCLTAANLFATQSVGLAWDPNTENDIAGYKVYWGTGSGNYGSPQVVGTTTATVDGLADQTTYYFAVTAYNQNGLESDYSNEVSYTTSSPTPTPTPTPTATPSPTPTPSPSPT